RNLSRDVEGKRAEGCDRYGDGFDGGDSSTATEQQLGPSKHCGAAEAAGHELGQEHRWRSKNSCQSGPISPAGAGLDAALWSDADDRAFAGIVEGAKRARALSRGRVDGPACEQANASAAD